MTYLPFSYSRHSISRTSFPLPYNSFAFSTVATSFVDVYVSSNIGALSVPDSTP
jgi:hypothetical protein